MSEPLDQAVSQGQRFKDLADTRPGATSRRCGPLVPEVGVIALVPEPWGEPWTTRHHFLTRLARYFNVVWVEPSLYWRDLSIGALRTIGWQKPAFETRTGMQILRASPWQPKVFWPGRVAAALTQRRLEAARRRLQESGSQAIVLYLWRPEFACALDYVPHAASCYHIDDEYSFAPVLAEPDPIEVGLIRRVDRVFIHSARLMEMKGHLNPATTLVPNGVDFDDYSRPREIPLDLSVIRGPRIGYVGVIKKQLNLDLMVELAQRRPDWSFVFVGLVLTIGDQSTALERLKRMPNVHLLGAKDVADLPAYMQHLDVGLLPYKIDAYTDCIYPLKLNEYLAAGRPVVGSEIASLQGLDDIVGTALSADDWISEISHALADDGVASGIRERRLAYAREHDWNGFVKKVATAIVTATDHADDGNWLVAIG